jgi:hypothetical protein
VSDFILGMILGSGAGFFIGVMFVAGPLRPVPRADISEAIERSRRSR